MPRKQPMRARDLSSFEGRDVLQTTIRITRAGDGLSQALAVDPQEFHLAETVVVVLECQVARVHHEELNDTGVLRRVHTLRAGTATIMDEDVVRAALDDQRLAIERAQGIERLPLAEAADE